MSDTTTNEEAVQRSIVLLDTCAPGDWRDQINLEHLNLDDGECCVLGQIYGDYQVGLEALHECWSNLDVFTPGLEDWSDTVEAFDSGYFEEAWMRALST